MTNMEFFILLGTVLAGVIWQRVDTMYTNGRIDRISDDLKQFYRTLGQHDSRLDGLEKK